MSDRIVMGYWDCPYCGSTGIEGTTYDCPNCGHQRGKDEHVYLSKSKITYKPGKHVKDAKYIDNYKFEGVDWYCEYCNALNSAKCTTCENCNSPRSKSSKTAFDFEKDVKKTPLPDPTRFMWECPSCKTLNDEKHTHCKSCGTEKMILKKQVDTIKSSVNKKDIAEDLTKISYVNPTPKEESKSVEKSYEEVSDKRFIEKSFIKQPRNFSFNFDFIGKFFNSDAFKAILAMIAIILVGFFAVKGIIYLLTPHPKTLEVTDMKWERIIDIESYETVREDGWSVPSGGRVQYTKKEVHHYDTVIDHYKTVSKSRVVPDGGHYETVTKTRTVQDGGHYDYNYSYNGDGTYTEHSTWVPEYKTETYTEQKYVQDYKTEYYTEQEPVYKDVPVYQTKYYYDIEKWIHKRYITTEGHDKDVYWGEVILASNEREASRSETYTVIAFEKKDKKQKEKTYTTSRDMWFEVENNTEIKVFTSLGTITSFNNEPKDET